MSHMNEVVSEARTVNESLRAFAVLSASPTHHRATESAGARECFGQGGEFVLLDAEVKERKAYRDCLNEGRGVVEMRSKKAKEEINALIEEVLTNEISYTKAA